ncbi:MAG TPA: hypothetical protein VJI67_03825, partial [archaeon]|nr:hypothetical protein [archaeon]
DFNIEKGEAEALALYWEKKADFLASDDQNVRRKTLILDLKIVGTLEIVLMLYRNGLISGEKAIDSLNELKRIGWFNSAVIEAALLEVKQ